MGNQKEKAPESEIQDKYKYMYSSEEVGRINELHEVPNDNLLVNLCSVAVLRAALDVVSIPTGHSGEYICKPIPEEAKTVLFNPYLDNDNKFETHDFLLSMFQIYALMSRIETKWEPGFTPIPLENDEVSLYASVTKHLFHSMHMPRRSYEKGSSDAATGFWMIYDVQMIDVFRKAVEKSEEFEIRPDATLAIRILAHYAARMIFSENESVSKYFGVELQYLEALRKEEEIGGRDKALILESHLFHVINLLLVEAIKRKNVVNA